MKVAQATSKKENLQNCNVRSEKRSREFITVVRLTRKKGAKAKANVRTVEGGILSERAVNYCDKTRSRLI